MMVPLTFSVSKNKSSYKVTKFFRIKQIKNAKVINNKNGESVNNFPQYNLDLSDILSKDTVHKL